jgi:hypothetical protein
MSVVDDTLFLNLIRISDKEGDKIDWSGFESSPEDLFKYIVDNFGVDPAKLDSIQRFSLAKQPLSLIPSGLTPERFRL